MNTGGMQDYNYIYSQCFEITIEVSCCKYPNASTLENYWNDNKVSLIEYMKKVHMGTYVLIIVLKGNCNVPQTNRRSYGGPF